MIKQELKISPGKWICNAIEAKMRAHSMSAFGKGRTRSPRRSRSYPCSLFSSLFLLNFSSTSSSLSSNPGLSLRYWYIFHLSNLKFIRTNNFSTLLNLCFKLEFFLDQICTIFCGAVLVLICNLFSGFLIILFFLNVFSI